MRDLSGALKRRGLLASVAALVGAGLANATGSDTAEAAGSLIIDANNAATATTFLLNADFNATRPVFVVGNHFQGVAASQPDGIQATTTGVGNAGVHGLCSDGYGILGDSVTGAGVRGQVVVTNVSGSGVVGVAAGCEMGNGAGVGVGGSGRGNGSPANKTGVLGLTDGGFGVEGWAMQGGTGIRGLANFGAGPDISGTGIGVEGRSGSGNGVQGTSTSGIGVYGQSTNSYGCGGATSKPGFAGLFGYAGVASAAAFLGVNGAPGGTAGYFHGAVTVDGPFQVVNGPKNALVAHPDGSHRRMYCQESPEPWFEDFGKSQLQGGKVIVRLDPDFAAVSRSDDYGVFLTAGGDCKGLYVANQTPVSFEVHELQGGTSSVPFSYRLVARRKDDVGGRMEKVELPKLAPLDVDKLPRTPEPPARPEPPRRP